MIGSESAQLFNAVAHYKKSQHFRGKISRKWYTENV